MWACGGVCRLLLPAKEHGGSMCGDWEPRVPQGLVQISVLSTLELWEGRRRHHLSVPQFFPISKIGMITV